MQRQLPPSNSLTQLANGTSLVLAIGSVAALAVDHQGYKAVDDKANCPAAPESKEEKVSAKVVAHASIVAAAAKVAKTSATSGATKKLMIVMLGEVDKDSPSLKLPLNNSSYRYLKLPLAEKLYRLIGSIRNDRSYIIFLQFFTRLATNQIHRKKLRRSLNNNSLYFIFIRPAFNLLERRNHTPASIKSLFQFLHAVDPIPDEKYTALYRCYGSVLLKYAGSPELRGAILFCANQYNIDICGFTNSKEISFYQKCFLDYIFTNLPSIVSPTLVASSASYVIFPTIEYLIEVLGWLLPRLFGGYQSDAFAIIATQFCLLRFGYGQYVPSMENSEQVMILGTLFRRAKVPDEVFMEAKKIAASALLIIARCFTGDISDIINTINIRSGLSITLNATLRNQFQQGFMKNPFQSLEEIMRFDIERYLQHKRTEERIPVTPEHVIMSAEWSDDDYDSGSPPAPCCSPLLVENESVSSAPGCDTSVASGETVAVKACSTSSVSSGVAEANCFSGSVGGGTASALATVGFFASKVANPAGNALISTTAAASAVPRN